MKSLLFITTSNGVYVLDDDSGQVKCILSNKHTPGFFKKKASGYFGITYHNKSGQVIIASREALGTKKHNKPATDTKLHAINPSTYEHKILATIMDVHDVHQITSDDNCIYLSDTGKNRVIVYDIENDKTNGIINIGQKRGDINHINAVRRLGKDLLIGLNNGEEDCAILSLNIDTLPENKNYEIDALELGTIKTIKNLSNSHDLEPHNDTILCCASKDGWVIDTNNSQVLISEKNWVRGLAISDNTLWVGSSKLATRKRRHSKALNGSIHKYNLNDYSLVKSSELNESGQINDMIHYSVEQL